MQPITSNLLRQLSRLQLARVLSESVDSIEYDITKLVSEMTGRCICESHSLKVNDSIASAEDKGAISQTSFAKRKQRLRLNEVVNAGCSNTLAFSAKSGRCAPQRSTCNGHVRGLGACVLIEVRLQ